MAYAAHRAPASAPTDPAGHRALWPAGQSRARLARVERSPERMSMTSMPSMSSCSSGMSMVLTGPQSIGPFAPPAVARSERGDRRGRPDPPSKDRHRADQRLPQSCLIDVGKPRSATVLTVLAPVRLERAATAALAGGIAGVGGALLRLTLFGPGPAHRVPCMGSVASAWSVPESACRCGRAWPDSASVCQAAMGRRRCWSLRMWR
jgi:hypothetical protein